MKLDGWAIENRVYAEDPYRGFLPSTGRLVRYRPPAERPVDERAYVRVDDGVAEGGEVSMFYDPMIAKLITWAPTREEAIDLQIAALDAFEIEGLGHNIDFLSALMQHPRFRAGALTTGFIAEEYPEGFHGAPAVDELIESARRDRRLRRHRRGRSRAPDRRPARRAPAAARRMERCKIGDAEHHVAISTRRRSRVDGDAISTWRWNTRRATGWSRRDDRRRARIGDPDRAARAPASS